MSIFSNEISAVAKFRDELSIGAGAYVNIGEVSDSALLSKLFAAEAELIRELRIPLEPTEIFTSEPTQEDIDSIAGRPYLVEPGYDMQPDYFSPQKWGMLELRVAPVISVTRMDFVYPSQGGASFSVPIGWIRLDHKYGHLHVFPSAQVVSAPMSIFMLQAVGAGYTIPNMIRVRYTAGLKDAATDYPDLVDLIYKMATFRMLQSAFLPSSGSISADGLSQSSSIDFDKWSGVIHAKIDSLRNAIRGPLYSVF